MIIDPIWWQTHYESDPFSTPDYKHGMSYYGDVPGELYAAVEREGEACTKWSETNQKHYTDRKLILIDCGGGWYCATYCN